MNIFRIDDCYFLSSNNFFQLRPGDVHGGPVRLIVIQDPLRFGAGQKFQEEKSAIGMRRIVDDRLCY